MNTVEKVPRASAGPSEDRGSVLVETAIAIPALIAVCMMLMAVLAIGVTTLALGDTARDAARALARGEHISTVKQAAEEASPKAAVSFQHIGSVIAVDIEQTLHLPGPILDSLQWTVRRSATAALEVVHAR
jgi:hypothetical protein